MTRKKTDFTTGEQKLLRMHYPTHMPLDQIVKLLPNHSEEAIRQHATKTLKLRRPIWNERPQPGWERMCDLLKIENLTLREVADQLGITKTRAYQIANAHVGEMYIIDWRPPVAKGQWSAIWAIGNEEDALRPFKRWSAAAIAERERNPFVVAAGLVDVPGVTRGIQGRTYTQSMSIRDEEEAAA